MRKSRFSEEQIIGDPQGARGGREGRGPVPAARDQRHDVLQVEGEVRRPGRLGGEEVCRSLEDENRRLKKLLAEQMLDNAALKDLVGKNF